MPRPIPTDRRSGGDLCPGALTLHAAADGGLARIRVPGGVLRRDQWAALPRELELTSRGNLQVRGVLPGSAGALADRLAEAGLLPSATHERVRNIVASPLSGRSGGRYDVRPWVAELDEKLMADVTLAGLPGRFLFALDDGRGDVAGLNADVTLIASGTDAAVLLGGFDVGRTTGDPVDLALSAAHAFLTERESQASDAWRLAELTDGPARVAARLTTTRRGTTRSGFTFRGPSPRKGTRPSGSTAGGFTSGGPGTGKGTHQPGFTFRGPGTGEGARLVGLVPQDDGRVAVSVLAPLGRLDAAQTEALGRAGDVVIVTPWRGVIVPDLDVVQAPHVLEELRRVGLITDASSPWAGVTSCTGRPGCAKARADVRADAAATLRAIDAAETSQVEAVVAAVSPIGAAARPEAAPVPAEAGPSTSVRNRTAGTHWAGCERQCGRPAGALVVLAVDEATYRIEDRTYRAADLPGALRRTV